MFVDIKRLFDTCESIEEYSFSPDLSAEDFPGYTVADTVSVSIQVQPEAGGLLVKAAVSATVFTQCARCLADIQKPVKFEAECLIREVDLAGEELDMSITPNGKLDVKELAYTELVLRVPGVLLCSNDCKGLCPVCGKRKPCECKTEEAVDERLAILKQLLS